MKRVNICKFISILNLLIFPVIILFNIYLNYETSIVNEEKERLKLQCENINHIVSIDCTYILESLEKDSHIAVKSIENENNNMYVNLRYYGNNEELKEFLKDVNSSKNFKGIKSLSINNTSVKELNENYHSNINEKTEDSNDSNKEYNKEQYNESNNKYQQIDITLQYIKRLIL